MLQARSGAAVSQVLFAYRFGDWLHYFLFFNLALLGLRSLSSGFLQPRILINLSV